MMKILVDNSFQEMRNDYHTQNFSHFGDYEKTFNTVTYICNNILIQREEKNDEEAETNNEE